MSFKLLSGEADNIGPHDHMDDLESFFYVLCHLLCSLVEPTSKIPNLPSHMENWELQDAVSCANNKLQYVRYPLKILKELGLWFAPYSRCLISSLRRLSDLFIPHIDTVIRASELLPEDGTSCPFRDWTIEKRLEEAQNHYTAFIDALETCMEAIKEVDEIATPASSTSEEVVSRMDVRGGREGVRPQLGNGEMRDPNLTGNRGLRCRSFPTTSR